ncbi:hypothetical protein CEQ90_13440 [Lewinellaceae bacterium SD302]|nr:hypothetical protein CEQ90_13440 [Lewinellaceae bacterium SD302]
MSNNNHTPRKKSNSGWALGLGLLAGAAIGYYLNSNEGRRMRNNIQSEFNDYGNQIGGIATEAGRLASNYANEARFKSQQLANNARNKASELADSTRQSINSGKDWVTTKAGEVKSTVVG